MYTGLIIAESLEKPDILLDKRITLTKEDIWHVGERAVDWQPKVWTALFITGADKDIGTIAANISDSILDKWYANLSDSTTEYVIFHKKIFSYVKGNNAAKQKARNYGKFIGVPEHQLDW
jgi:hypothetical protein